ncbi:MAG: Zn-dependent alcohol dehydrogenase [Proteobacteria bacterium]|nr:Zn-dependent alcohol dehydrogenase [Pseudomonadota bacterium]
MKTKAAVLYEYKQPLIIEELDLDGPKQGEVLVEIKAAGLCHTDLSIMRGVYTVPPTPCVIGHEGAGIVREVGPGVEKFKVGDHVVGIWVPSCGQCYYCQRNQPYLCVQRDLTRAGTMLDGTTRLTKGGKAIYNMTGLGTFKQFTVVAQQSLLRIEDSIPFEVAALTGCGVITGVGAVLNTADVEPGSSVAVLGIGGVGVNVIQGAVLAAATKIIAIDLLDNKLEQAVKMGATHTINASRENAQEKVMEITGGIGVDYAFDVVGGSKGSEIALSLIRRGGSSVIIAVPSIEQKAVVPLTEFVITEKKLMGCYYGSSNLNSDMQTLLDLYKMGRLKVEELISDRYSLDDINQGFDDLIAGKNLRGVVIM